MNIFRTLHRSILILFAVVLVSIVTLVHISISKIVAEQSRAQQQSHSPALQLITDGNYYFLAWLRWILLN